MGDARATVEAFYEAINDRRMDDALERLTDDVLWHRPPDVPITGMVEGVERVRRMWLGFTGSLESFEIEATGFEESPDALMAVITMRGTTPEGRGDFEFGGCQVFRFAGGRISEVREFRSLDHGREALATA